MIDPAFAAAVEQSGSGLPQFDPSSFASQIFWAVVSFAVLLFLLKKYVLPPINNILDERANRIRIDMEKAERLRQEAEQVLAAYQKQLDAVQDDAAIIMEASRKEAAEAHKKAMRQIEQDMKKKKDVFSAEIEYAKRQALKEVRSIAAEVAMLATEKLVAKKVTKADASKMVESSIKELGSLTDHSDRSH